MVTIKTKNKKVIKRCACEGVNVGVCGGWAWAWALEWGWLEELLLSQFLGELGHEIFSLIEHTSLFVGCILTSTCSGGRLMDM